MKKATCDWKFDLSKQAKDAGLSYTQLQQILDSDVLMDIFKTVKLGKPISREKFRMALGLEASLLICKIVVDYNLSLAEMIKAGGYNWVNNNIIAENFPIQREDKEVLEITLLPFNRPISSDKVIKRVCKAGYRPANLPELLALGFQHPDFQRQFPIPALGSVWWLHPSGPCVPCLWGDDWERGLHFRQLKDIWHPGYRFAVVHITQTEKR